MAKLTGKTIEAIEEKIALGVPIEVIAPAIGVTYQCVYLWQSKGERYLKKKKPLNEYQKLCVELFEAIKRGRLRFVEGNLAMIQAAAPKNWQAAAWLLERRYPKHFAKIEKSDGTNAPQPEAAKIENLEGLTQEDLSRRYDAHKLQFWA